MTSLFDPPSTMRMHAQRAQVKPANCQFKGRHFSPNATPVLLPQSTIVALGCCKHLQKGLRVGSSMHGRYFKAKIFSAFKI